MSAGIQQYPTATSSGDESSTSSFYPKCRHFRFFKRKGAVLVLLWSFCSLFAFNFVVNKNNGDRDFLSLVYLRISPLTVFVMCALFYPILCLLADARYGRYKMIKWSLLLMWVSFILYCLALVLLKSIHLAKDQFKHARLYWCNNLLFSPNFHIISRGEVQASEGGSFLCTPPLPPPPPPPLNETLPPIWIIKGGQIRGS